MDYSNVVGYDKAANPSEWKSVSQATYVAPGAESTKEFSTSFKTLSHPKPEELEEYKKRWCAAVGAGCFGVAVVSGGLLCVGATGGARTEAVV